MEKTACPGQPKSAVHRLTGVPTSAKQDLFLDSPVTEVVAKDQNIIMYLEPNVKKAQMVNNLNLKIPVLKYMRHI